MLAALAEEFKRALGRASSRNVSLVLAAILLGFSATAAEPDRPNVLLITLDTMRADRLSSYGYERLTTPNLDRLASEGVRFDRAYTVIPLTGPAHVSLFTSRYPQENGAKVNGQPLADDERLLTLTEILKKHGYSTAAYVSAWPLKARLTRLGQSFDIYDEDFTSNYQLFNSYRKAEEVTPKAIQWLRHASANPFFLWIHYFDPHKPYLLQSEFADPPKNAAGQRATDAKPAVSEEMADRMRRYDSEVAYMDHHIGKLLEELGRLGLKESTLVLVVSDHGESLGERGYVGHGRHLFESIVRVPLILRYPKGLRAGHVVREHVSILDVMPTVLDLAGIDYPLPLRGRTLVPLLEGGVRSSNGEANGPIETNAGHGPRDGVREPSDTTYFLTFPGKKWQAPKWLSWLWYHDSKDRMPLKLGWIRDERKVVWTPRSETLEVFRFEGAENSARTVYSGKAAEEHRLVVNELRAWFEATLMYRDEEFRLKQEDLEVLKSLGYVDD